VPPGWVAAGNTSPGNTYGQLARGTQLLRTTTSLLMVRYWPGPADESRAWQLTLAYR